MANAAEVQIFIDETMLDALSSLKDENERLQRTLRMVDDWIASTLPGSSSETIRALIAEALERKPA